MDNQTLTNLIERSKRNDQKAFRTIVENYQFMVYSLAFRLLGNEDEAKDIVQESFIRVWTNLASYRTDKKFSTWMYTIATNLCLDKLKSTKYNLKNNDCSEVLINLVSSDNAEQHLMNSELGEVIQTLTNELTTKQKIVFTLRCLEELEIDEIIQITGMTAGKIKSNLFLARQAIQQKLEKYENYGK